MRVEERAEAEVAGGIVNCSLLSQCCPSELCLSTMLEHGDVQRAFVREGMND